MKKLLSILLATVLSVCAFSGCSMKAENPKNETERVTVRFLNFKPEIANEYKEIAKKYEQKTGVRVEVETAASNTYESTLTAKMSTSSAPTIFQINGTRGYNAWKDYCEDLSDTELYKHLNDKNLAIRSNGAVYGIPYTVEGYGIICNEEIFDKYFKLKTRKTKINSLDEIKSFDTLKAVAEDMQKNKKELGIDGAFASTSLKSGEDWRWQTHLLNIPLYYEFNKKNIDYTDDSAMAKIDFEYGDNYKNILDLYMNNSITDKKLLGSKIVDESMAEFSMGRCAMVQNGNWAWSQIKDVDGNKVKEENVKFLPVYLGIEGEQNQGLCIGTENFICVNKKATENEKKAAKEFLYWLFSSDEGKEHVLEDLDFIAPFDTFEDDELPEDPLSRQVIDWSKREDVKTVPWIFTTFPSASFKTDVGASILQYAQGKSDWNTLKNKVTSRWEQEMKNLK